MVSWTRDRLGGDRERGASLIEFAFVAPILFFLLFGIIEFGRYVAFVEGVNTATREAARYGSAATQVDDCAGIYAEALELSGVAHLKDANITVEYFKEDGTPNGDCETAPLGPDAAVTAGDQIVVTVSKDFDSVVPIIASVLNSRTVESVDRRTIFIGEFGNPNP
jgi:hypothetical protein